MHKAFLETKQRPLPLPTSPWMMTQTWNHLLFFHYKVSAQALRKVIPRVVELDLFKGDAWLGIHPFRVSHLRFRYLPPVPLLHSYLELNVRTYVTYKGIPGIYFLSLDAEKWPIVLGAQLGTLLPYRHAGMKMTLSGSCHYFLSKREHPNSQQETFTIEYEPTSNAFLPDRDSLEYWLYERYCFFNKKGQNVYRGDIHHDRWRVKEAKAVIHANTLTPFLPDSQSEKPIFHYVDQKQVFAWPLRRM